MQPDIERRSAPRRSCRRPTACRSRRRAAARSGSLGHSRVVGGSDQGLVRRSRRRGRRGARPTSRMRSPARRRRAPRKERNRPWPGSAARPRRRAGLPEATRAASGRGAGSLPPPDPRSRRGAAIGPRPARPPAAPTTPSRPPRAPRRSARRASARGEGCGRSPPGARTPGRGSERRGRASRVCRAPARLAKPRTPRVACDPRAPRRTGSSRALRATAATRAGRPSLPGASHAPAR